MTPRSVCRATILGLGALASACATVPGSGRSQLLLVTEAEEADLGLKAWQQVLDKEKLSADAKAIALVEKVGKRIAQAADRKDFAWEFKAIEGKQANAFCLPGGKIAVYTGILPITADEDGLAVVIGHEVAHAMARHGGERLSHGLVAEVGAAAVSKALGRGDEGTTKAVHAALGIGLGIGVLLPFSRTHESEADRIGLTLMAKAGYHPRHAIKFWERMEKAGGGAGIELLSTHPAHKTRVRQIQRWLPEALRHYRQ